MHRSYDYAALVAQPPGDVALAAYRYSNQQQQSVARHPNDTRPPEANPPTKRSPRDDNAPFGVYLSAARLPPLVAPTPEAAIATQSAPSTSSTPPQTAIFCCRECRSSDSARRQRAIWFIYLSAASATPEGGIATHDGIRKLNTRYPNDYVMLVAQPSGGVALAAYQ
jgi:hypothetical protein